MNENEKKIMNENEIMDTYIELKNDEGDLLKLKLVYLCEIKDEQYVIFYDEERDEDVIFRMIQTDEEYEYEFVDDADLIKIICDKYYNDEE